MQLIRLNPGQQRRQGVDQGKRCTFRYDSLRHGCDRGTGATRNARRAMATVSGLPVISMVRVMIGIMRLRGRRAMLTQRHAQPRGGRRRTLDRNRERKHERNQPSG